MQRTARSILPGRGNAIAIGFGGSYIATLL